MNRINPFQFTPSALFESKPKSPLLEIFKGIVLLCFSQCASLFARAQIIKGDQVSALARRALNQNVSVVNWVSDQVVEPGSPFYLSVNDVFSDVENVEATASHLPSWLKFYPSIRSALTLDNYYTGINLLGDLAYLTTNGWPGLEIVNISSLASVGIIETGLDTTDFVIEGDLGYIVGYYGYLQVLNLTEGSIISQFALQAGGMKLTVQDSLAYVTLGLNGTMQMVDISNLYQLQNAGVCDLGGYAVGIAVANKRVYVANALRGLQVIDPLTCIVTGEYATTNSSWDVAVEDHLAYVTASESLEIIDVANDTALSLVGSYYAGGRIAITVHLEGDLAYVSEAFPGGVSYINISKPSHPFLSVNVGIDGIATEDVAIQGDKIYAVADGYFNFYEIDPFHPCGFFWGTPTADDHGTSTISLTAGDAFDQFHLYVSTPPILLSDIADQSLIPGKSLNLFINNDIFYDPDLSPLSLSANPLPPWLFLVNYPILLGFTEGGFANLAVDDKFAYEVQDTLLRIFDLSVPNPILVGELPLFFNISIWGYRIEVEGDLVYITGGTGASGFIIVNVADRSKPYLVTYYETPDSVSGIVVRDKIAFVTCFGAGLLILNMTNLSNITKLSQYLPLSSFVDITIDGDLAFVTDENNGFLILGISNLQNIKLVGSYTSELSTYFIFNAYLTRVSGKKAYMATTESIEIVDLTNLANPTLAGEIFNSMELLPGAMEVVGKLLYTAFGDWQIYDVSNSSNALLVGSFDVAFDLKIRNQLAYVEGLDFLEIYDLTKWKLIGTPMPEDAGNYEIEVIATDPAGLSASNSFTIRVEGPPVLVKPIPNHMGYAGTPLTFFIDQSNFQDPNGDIISYSASLSDASWLSFSPTGIFTGIPSASDAKLYTIQVTAFDGIVPPTNSTDFDLTIIDVLGRQTTRVGGSFYYSLDNEIVINPQGAVTYTSTQSNGAALPAWLKFNPATATYKGTPQEADKGVWTIIATGNDGVQPPVTVSFTLLVNENSAPVVENQISNQVANVNQLFRLVVPDNTFSDPNGDTLTYTASGLGEPLPNWISFDGKTRTFQGTPSRSDTGAFNPAIVPIQLTASDGQLQASTAFSISVEGKSNAAIALSVIGSISSAVGTIWAGYKNRAYFFNWKDKEAYRKPAQAVYSGSPYSYKLEVFRKEVVRVQAFKGKKVHFDINKPRKLRGWLTYDAPLPGELLLPNWLEYDCNTNVLQSKYDPRPEDVGKYLIRVFGKDGVIKSEFELKVLGEEAASITQMEIEENPRYRSKKVIPYVDV